MPLSSLKSSINTLDIRNIKLRLEDILRSREISEIVDVTCCNDEFLIRFLGDQGCDCFAYSGGTSCDFYGVLVYHYGLRDKKRAG